MRLASNNLFAAAFHFHGGCRQNFANHATLFSPRPSLPSHNFRFNAEWREKFAAKVFDFQKCRCQRANRIVRFDSSEMQFPFCHREAANL